VHPHECGDSRNPDCAQDWSVPLGAASLVHRDALIFTAIGLSRRNWVSLAIMLVFPTAALLYRIHVEEMG